MACSEVLNSMAQLTSCTVNPSWVSIKSTAIAFGRFDVPILGALMGAMTALLVGIGMHFLPHPAWFTAVAGAFIHFQIQLWRIRTRDPQACFSSFLSNHWVGLILFLGAAVSFATAGH